MTQEQFDRDRLTVAEKERRENFEPRAQGAMAALFDAADEPDELNELYAEEPDK